MVSRQAWEIPCVHTTPPLRGFTSVACNFFLFFPPPLSVLFSSSFYHHFPSLWVFVCVLFLIQILFVCSRYRACWDEPFWLMGCWLIQELNLHNSQMLSAIHTHNTDFDPVTLTADPTTIHKYNTNFEHETVDHITIHTNTTQTLNM